MNHQIEILQLGIIGDHSVIHSQHEQKPQGKKSRSLPVGAAMFPQLKEKIGIQRIIGDKAENAAAAQKLNKIVVQIRVKKIPLRRQNMRVCDSDTADGVFQKLLPPQVSQIISQNRGMVDLTGAQKRIYKSLHALANSRKHLGSQQQINKENAYSQTEDRLDGESPFRF